MNPSGEPYHVAEGVPNLPVDPVENPSTLLRVYLTSLWTLLENPTMMLRGYLTSRWTLLEKHIMLLRVYLPSLWALVENPSTLLRVYLTSLRTLLENPNTSLRVFRDLPVDPSGEPCGAADGVPDPSVAPDGAERVYMIAPSPGVRCDGGKPRPQWGKDSKKYGGGAALKGPASLAGKKTARVVVFTARNADTSQPAVRGNGHQHFLH